MFLSAPIKKRSEVPTGEGALTPTCDSAANATGAPVSHAARKTQPKPAGPRASGFHCSAHQTLNFHAISTSHLWALHVYLSHNNILGFFRTFSRAAASQ